MSNYIVLVKQVPDVSQITDNAFDPETGTLVRSRLASVINELDTQALAFANRLKEESGDSNSKIVCLTMGPPMAEEVLRYCLSRCADVGVLLTDRSLGGADTWATANPLAYAVRKIVKEFFHNNTDYYVISGMQSVDGDTAQVPPQIAEELSLPCIAYATEPARHDGTFQFSRIISGGSQIVTARKPPAVITVAKYEYPVFATFSLTRKANSMEVVKWGSEDIKAPYIGVKGSKTRVIRVFPPGKSTRKLEEVEDIGILAKMLVESFREGEELGGECEQQRNYVLPGKREDKFDRSFEGTKKEIEDFAFLGDKLNELGVKELKEVDEDLKEKILSESGKRFHKKALEDMLSGLRLTEPSYIGEVWVVAEHSDGKVHPATFELVGKSRELADSLDTKVGVCLAGYKLEQMSDELIAGGADNIYIIEDKLLEEFDPGTYRKAVADCIKRYWPQIVLYAATPQGRMLAPMVSYSVECGLTADCTGLEIKDSSRKGQIGLLYQTRPALGGNVMATIVTKDSRCQMATARPGVMKRLPADESRKGKVIRHEVSLSKEDVSLNILKTEMATGQVNFDADIIVSGGKGMQNRDNYERVVGSLCDALRKRLDAKVERGASRAAVEQGFADRVHQVGQTGTSVGPKIYVALGISGAIQHMIGVANSDIIVALNSDPSASIFKQCDYYYVGTIEEAVPQLIQSLQQI